MDDNDGGGIIVLLAIIGLAYWWFHESYTYTAEVGFYSGESISYDYRYGLADLDECRNAADSLMGFYGTRTANWSCFKTDSDGNYISRHR